MINLVTTGTGIRRRRALNPAAIAAPVARLASLGRALAFVAEVIAVTVSLGLAGIAYAVIGWLGHLAWLADARPNAAMWWLVGWDAAGLVALVWVCQRLVERWTR